MFFLKNNIRIFFFSVFLFVVLGNFCLAQRELEVQYPTIPGAPVITSETILPEYVKYIFNLSIAISGLIAFGILIIAGVRYMTSAGNPSTMKDAQEQIFSAFLGLLILLCAWIILTTINPQLVQLELPAIK